MWTAFFKLCGGGMLVWCGWLAGSARADGLRRRRMLFEDLVTLCGLLQRNLEGKREPLPSFFQEELAAALFSVLRFDGAKKQPFERWYAAFWDRSAGCAPLREEEVSRIRAFWDALGSTGGEEEAGRLRFFSQYFASLASQAKEAEQQNTRLCRSLGVCAGVVVALLLV